MIKRLPWKQLLFLMIGNLLVAFAVANFVLPYQLITGGMSGVAIILNQFFNWNEQIVINALLIICFILGYFFLGKKFALKTIFSTIYYPIALDFCLRFPIQLQTNDLLLIAIFAGIFIGMGVGMVFSVGASTGGMDIPPLIINKYFHINISLLIMLTDGLIILIGLFVTNIEMIMLGIVTVIISSIMINKMIVFESNKMMKVLIITNKIEEITKWIHDDLDRGTTLIDACGGYTNKPRPIIMTIVDNRQLSDLMNHLHEVDEEAFTIINEVHEVRGYGFAVNQLID